VTNINPANPNELYVDRDIMVLANPEIANLPGWVIALVAAGALAAALSTAAGLLLVISSSVSHDLIKKVVNPNISEKGELMAARLSAVAAVCVAGYFGINIFYKRMNKEGAIAGMVVGITAMLLYMIKYKLGWFDATLPGSDEWWFGISPEGFGTIAMLINFAVSLVVCHFTSPPPQEVQDIVENIRIPSGAGEATGH